MFFSRDTRLPGIFNNAEHLDATCKKRREASGSEMGQILLQDTEYSVGFSSVSWIFYTDISAGV